MQLAHTMHDTPHHADTMHNDTVTRMQHAATEHTVHNSTMQLADIKRNDPVKEEEEQHASASQQLRYHSKALSIHAQLHAACQLWRDLGGCRHNLLGCAGLGSLQARAPCSSFVQA